MKKLLFLPLFVFLSCSSEDQDKTSEPEIMAEAEIFMLGQISDKEFEIQDESVGKATFFQTGDVVTIEIQLQGMTPNTSKAVHIHDGSVEVPGRHWNAGKFVAACSTESMGRDWERPFIGDVGNVPIDANGEGIFTLQTDLWKINSGDESDILDKVIIVHQDPEDFVEECDPLHYHDYIHSNQKIGGGKIKLVSDVPQAVQSYVSPEQLMPDFLICK